MQKYQPIIPKKFDYLFGDITNKLFAEYLTSYVLFDTEIKTSPALWQDAEIFIRYKKRNVWSLTDEQRDNARFAMLIYQTKYVINHFKKPEILDILNKFFTQNTNNPTSIQELFEKKLHTSFASLFLSQEKITITKEKINDFDKIFDYPCWVEFTDEANDIIFKKILDNKLTDEQLDYFLGASDDMSHYDKWFKVVKHILKTTKNSHVFWTAGDILNIIWQAIPEDEKSEKWIKDEIFDIFWPRVNSIWPLKNEHKIDFDQDEETKILSDSIGWLRSLDDLKERLPELGESYELREQHSNETEFAYIKGLLMGKLSSTPQNIDDLINQFFILADHAYTKNHITELQKIANEKLIPLITNLNSDNKLDIIDMIHRAISHAKKYLADLTRERKNLAKIVQ